MKKDLTRIFIDKIYSRPPMKNFSTNKMIYNHIDIIWSINLADMVDYKTSNTKGFRYIFIEIDNFSKYLWAIPLKNNCSQTITHEFSKPKPNKLESNKVLTFITIYFKAFWKVKIYITFQDSQIEVRR